MKVGLSRMARSAVISLLFSTALVSVDSHAQIPQHERDALIALYNSAGGPNWRWVTCDPFFGFCFSDPPNWLRARGTECTWLGVACTNNSVTSLYLWNKGLTGTIPTELGNLSNLGRLDLSNNALRGTIPTSFANLKKLRFLELSRNQITGTIPSGLGSLVNLWQLDLSANQLTGNIPAELGNLTTLRDLFLSANNLSGSIPPELGNLVNLQYLNLGNNKLTGEIPAELGNITYLLRLYLSYNNLSGPIPPEFGDFEFWTSIELAYNQLSGVVPYGVLAKNYHVDGNVDLILPTSPRGILLRLYEETDGDNWSNNAGWKEDPDECSWFGITCADGDITEVSLTNNGLTGTLLPDIYYLPSLEVLDLGGNQLTGTIPRSLELMPNLSTLSLESNQLIGEVPLTLLDNPELELFLDGNSGLHWWEGWPAPYNGITPDSLLEMDYNNIGIYYPADQLTYVCLSVREDGVQSAVNGVDHWGIGLDTISLSEGNIKIAKMREFNKGHALNEFGELPECSGQFETTTNTYTDTIKFGPDIYSVSYELYDPINLELREVDKTLLHSLDEPARPAEFNGSALIIPVIAVGEQFYELELSYVAGTSPEELAITHVREIFYTSPDGASVFSEGVLSIPSIFVGEVSWWADFQLVDHEPVTFRLVNAGIN